MGDEDELTKAFKYFREEPKLYPLFGIKIPKPITEEWFVEAKALGLLMKSQLTDGVYYFGKCRNARVARWDSKKERFTYMRTKFTEVYPEDVNHPEDDNGYDLFVPLNEVIPDEYQIIKDSYEKPRV